MPIMIMIVIAIRCCGFVSVMVHRIPKDPVMERIVADVYAAEQFYV